MAGTLQPAAYSPVRTTISAMAGQAGTDRWVMTGGIFLTGGCYLVTAAGLTGIRVLRRALLIVAGMAGMASPHPPKPPAARPPAPRLDHARRRHDHRMARLRRPGRLTAAADPERPRLRRRHRRLRGPARRLLAETRDGSVLGLAERLTSSIQTCWPFIVAVALRRTRRPRPGGPPAAAAG